MSERLSCACAAVQVEMCSVSTSPVGKIASTSVTGAWARRLRVYFGLMLTLLYPADDSSKRETGRNATSANIAAAKVSIPPCLARGQRVGVSSPETVRTRFGRSQCLPSLLVLIFPSVVLSAGCGRHHPHHPRPAVHVEDASRPYGRHWCVFSCHCTCAVVPQRLFMCCQPHLNGGKRCMVVRVVFLTTWWSGLHLFHPDHHVVRWSASYFWRRYWNDEI